MTGYQGSFKKRTRSMRDGCATFFKKSLFRCEAVVPVEYFVPNVASLDRDNVALLLLLQPKHQLLTAEQTQLRKVCVANTHLLFNPRRGDVKLAQLMKLFAEIDSLTYQTCPVLICGDMNVEPFSQLYRFIRHGRLMLQGQPAAKLSGQQEQRNYGSRHPVTADFLGHHAGITDQSQYVSVCQERFRRSSNPAEHAVVDEGHYEAIGPSYAQPVPYTDTDDTDVEMVYTQGTGIVSHQFALDSVYTHIMTCGNTGGKRRHKSAREVTTCHMLANCTVDYVFYTPTVIYSETDSSRENTDCSLTLLARLQLLSDKEMNQIGQLPNRFISSDHLILAAEFLLTSR